MRRSLDIKVVYDSEINVNLEVIRCINFYTAKFEEL